MPLMCFTHPITGQLKTPVSASQRRLSSLCQTNLRREASPRPTCPPHHGQGQKTNAVLTMLEEMRIIVVFVPPNTTDRLQPLDLSANRAVEDFLRQWFYHWYPEQVKQQLQSNAGNDASKVEVDMKTTVMKELKSSGLQHSTITSEDDQKFW